MIIRATNKLLNISRIKTEKNDTEIVDSLPGEWYASLLSTGRQGGYAIHFLHNPTMISIIILGKSLIKAQQMLPASVASLLNRNGFSELLSGYKLDSPIEIYATNSRNLLANMNQMKLNIEYHLALAESTDTIDLKKIEDIHLKYILGGKIADGKYITPREKLKQLLNKLGSR